jgi:hypothetical protein
MEIKLVKVRLIWKYMDDPAFAWDFVKKSCLVVGILAAITVSGITTIHHYHGLFTPQPFLWLAGLAG